MVRIYFHPSVGEYYRCDSFEFDYALMSGVPTGILTYGGGYTITRRVELSGVAGLVVGGIIGGLVGTLYPKRILSWYEPPPFDPPIRYPSIIPDVVIPSFIGDRGQLLNLLFYEGYGDRVVDHSGNGFHGEIYFAEWSDEDLAGWSVRFKRRGYIAIEKMYDFRKPYTLEVLFKLFDYDGYVVRDGHDCQLEIASQRKKIRFSVRVGAPEGWKSWWSRWTHELGKWYLLFLLFDGKSVRIRVYSIDGVETDEVLVEELPVERMSPPEVEPYIYVSGSIIRGAHVGAIDGEVALLRVYERIIGNREMDYHWKSIIPIIKRW